MRTGKMAPVTTTRPREIIADRYELGEPIGHGGMGDVYAAHDLRLDRPVALKLLRSALAEDPGMRARVEAEAKASARLTHPNVVAVFDAGEDDRRPFIAMELLDGRTLADRIVDGPMSQDEVRSLARQVLGALGAAHGAGIVHRDVKPRNVLQAPEGTWKVGDFGIAKQSGSDLGTTKTGELLGTASYIAPERLEGAAATSASDLYSVGVMLYEALTGERPYPGTDPMAVAMLIMEGRNRPVRSVRPDADPALAGAIERAMARRPEDRFADTDAMTAALAESDTGATTRITGVAPDDSHATTRLIERSPAPTGVLPSGAVPTSSPGSIPPEPIPSEPAGPLPLHHPAVRLLGRVVAIAAALLVVGVLAVVLLVGSGDKGSGAGRTAPSVSSGSTTAVDHALDRLDRLVRP
jgi:eukaryotic-like serine/threonine-protein kinase